MKFFSRTLTIAALATATLQASPCCDFGTFFAEASFLYWNASMGDLEFVGEETTRIQNSGNPPKTVIATLDPKHPNFEFSPGVRASIGYLPCSCNFAFLLEGTYLRSTADGNFFTPKLAASVAAGFPHTGVPLLMGPFIGNIVSDTHSEWKLTFGTLDLIAGAICKPCSCLALIPNFGLRGAWIEQDFQIDYHNIGFLIAQNLGSGLLPSNQNANSDVSLHSHYRAIGFKGGCDFEAPLFCNISLFGGLGASVLYGESKVNQNTNGFNAELDNTGAPVLTLLNYKEKERLWLVKANIETELGLAYNGSCSCFGYELALSYFFAYWFDQNAFYDFGFSPASTSNGVVTGTMGSVPTTSGVVFINFFKPQRRVGNLGLQGLVASVGVNF